MEFIEMLKVKSELDGELRKVQNNLYNFQNEVIKTLAKERNYDCLSVNWTRIKQHV